METRKIKWIDEYITQALEIAWLEGHERALKLLGKILYEEPGYGRLHNALGIIFYKYADELKRAERHFRFAIKFDPELAEPYGYLADMLKQDERHDETIKICLKGLDAEKANRSSLLENIGNAWELKRKYRKAIKSYREALSHSTELWNCRVLELSIKRCKKKQR